MAKRKGAVGFGQPPTNTQFKPGKSGNPKGRPKKAKNFKSDLVDELSQKVLLTEDGKQTKISKQRAVIKSLMAKAVQGDAHAAGTVIKLVERMIPEEPEEQIEEPLKESDQMILDLFLARNESKGVSNDE
jgi:hypothetical protein